jgi:hypothetical protein
MGLVGLPSSTRAGWESLPASSCAGSENIFDRRNLTSLKAVWDDANGLGASDSLAATQRPCKPTKQLSILLTHPFPELFLTAKQDTIPDPVLPFR